MTDVLTRLRTGILLKAKEHDKANREKLGVLRGGSSGLVLPGGESVGKCPRVVHLRMLGLEERIDANTSILFEGGLANEHVVEALLRRGLAEGEELESEPNVELLLPSGAKVAGRPDLLLKVGGRPARALELKNVSSLWTARDVHYELKPKADHLIQAGLYSLALGKLPYSLLYTSFSQFHLSTAPWLQAKFGKDALDVEYKVSAKTGKLEPLKILSFFREYDLTWSPDGFLCYQTNGLDKPVRTEVSLEALDRFYQRVLATGSMKVLPQRPSAAGVDGSKSYSPCDYCWLKETCDKQENNYDLWLDEVRTLPDTRSIHEEDED